MTGSAKQSIAPAVIASEAIHRLGRHCERSEAIHLATVRKNGLLRCARNDVEFQTRVRNLFVEEPLDEIAPAIEVRAKANWFLSIALAWNIGPRAHRGQAQALSLFFGP